MNVTRWSPDTCGCVIELRWDPALSEDDRVHEHHASVVTCADHPGLGGNGHLGAILRENQSKNRVHSWLLENVPRVRKPHAAGDGFDLADGVEYRWSFSGKGSGRKLRVEFPGAALTAAEKAQLRAHAADHLDVPVTVA